MLLAGVRHRLSRVLVLPLLQVQCLVMLRMIHNITYAHHDEVLLRAAAEACKRHREKGVLASEAAGDGAASPTRSDMLLFSDRPEPLKLHKQFCDSDDLLAVSNAMQGYPLRPVIMFRDAIRRAVDRASTMKTKDWLAVTIGRMRKVKFATAFVKEVHEQLGDDFQGLVRYRRLPRNGPKAYCHFEPVALSLSRALYSRPKHRDVAGLSALEPIPLDAHVLPNEGEKTNVTLNDLSLVVLHETDVGVQVRDIHDQMLSVALGRGDVVHSINGLEARTLPLKRVMEQLKSVRSPMITFIRVSKAKMSAHGGAVGESSTIQGAALSPLGTYRSGDAPPPPPVEADPEPMSPGAASTTSGVTQGSGTTPGAARQAAAMSSVVYSVVFPKRSMGLKLAFTPTGLKVTGFAPSFDRDAGKDIELDDYLVAVNELSVRGMDLEKLQRVLNLTSPPRYVTMRNTQCAGCVSRLYSCVGVGLTLCLMGLLQDTALCAVEATTQAEAAPSVPGHVHRQLGRLEAHGNTRGPACEGLCTHV